MFLSEPASGEEEDEATDGVRYSIICALLMLSLTCQ